jgi:hypothetical protein
MTICQFVETITGKAAAHYGAFADSTAFNVKGMKAGRFGEMLTAVGYHSSGYEVLYNGMTGEQIETEIFIGPTYYMRLKHMVKDKINYRGPGPMTALTRQPVEGRANDGGLRIGEMERDAIIAHGATNFLTESMMERSDKYQIAICNKTGMIAIYNPAKNLFLSPMADGPLRYIGTRDLENIQVQNISKFGRSFSVVAVPYSFKLMMQELQCMNIQMRIITEDNIEQIQSMSFSKNIERLTGFDSKTDIKDFNMKGVINDIRNKVNRDEIKTPIKGEYGQFKINEQPEQNIKSPVYNPNTPSDYSPNQYDPNSPAYAQGSPAYNPIISDESPEYIPRTPSDYSPIDSIHDPNSPQYNKEIDGGSDVVEGTRISIRGEEPNPEDYWLVTHTTPDFITIENQNRVSNSDIIRVLDKTQVMPYQAPQYQPQYQPQFQQQYQPQFQQQYQLPYGVQQYEPSHGNISVNPIIKIVNGNDESTGTLDSGQPQPISIPPIISNSPIIESIKQSNPPPESTSIDEQNFNVPMIVVKKN